MRGFRVVRRARCRTLRLKGRVQHGLNTQHVQQLLLLDFEVLVELAAGVALIVVFGRFRRKLLKPGKLLQQASGVEPGVT